MGLFHFTFLEIHKKGVLPISCTVFRWEIIIITVTSTQHVNFQFTIDGFVALTQNSFLWFPVASFYLSEFQF